ncbi:MAG: DNA polymerase/3'-5' exonuclease PolX, partial [Alphaproteobacteria bacterium]|nr:DNA polymerase/3'-5' exonuclease PolX [Alphaproteobacteria bacterium]
MPIRNADVATVFDEISDILEIQGANPFRVRAYRNAGRLLRSLDAAVTDMVAGKEDLTALPGIGADLAGKIREIVETGTCAMLEKLHEEMPEGLTELLKVPGLGPKRVQALYHELDVRTLEQLHRAAKDGRIRQLPGFGEKTEDHILQAVEALRQRPERFKLATAAEYAGPLVEHLRAATGVKRVVVAGSFRRARETVGDLDILVTATPDNTVMQRFVDYEEVAEVVSKGPTRSTVVLRSGLQVDVRVVAEESYGAALHYFTGSKAHNIAVRRLGRQRGLKINEYGVFRGNRRISGNTEGSVFRAVGLRYISPELRENRGEIEAAREGKLPKLVEFEDLRGDLHVHTTATDGRNSLREMALAARDLGLEYVAVTEHSRRVTVAHGLTSRRLLAQIDEIDALNEEKIGVHILKGIEVDILEDGRLDLPDDVLGRLDLVIGAVHSRFNLSRERQTERIMRAMNRPHFTLLAHPSGRLIPRREPYDVDMGRIIRHARERGCYLELNAH